MADTKGGIIGFPVTFPNVDVNEGTASINIGTKAYGLDRVNGTEMCEYMYVLNNAAAAVVQWNPSTFDTTAAGRGKLIKPTTNSLVSFAGVCAGQNGITNANYGWFLTKGPGKATVDGTGTAIAAGETLKCQNATYNMIHDGLIGVAPAFPSYALAGAAATTATTIAATIMANV